ncbi:hypothetical protein GOBAR_DD20130 [Gossypium barbadense]|nr:hypothetical protein GOBAR_DD20130 [Gossypium barbadense]
MIQQGKLPTRREPGSGEEAFAIVYSPDFGSRPEVWPSLEGARRLLSEFKKLPLSKQKNKMFNQQSFLKQSIAKDNSFRNCARRIAERS